jgi:pilus assembly protein CpaB
MNKRILAGLAAVLLAVVGTVAVFAYARGADRRALQGQTAIGAYVAVKDVPAGTTAAKAISDGLIVKEMIASKGVPEGALTSVDGSYDNLVATSDLQPGELVLKARFGSVAAADGRLPVPSGKMAISVALDDPSHVGSFVVVGSHIAVFDTFNYIQKCGCTAIPGISTLTPTGDHLQDSHEYQRATRVLVPDVTVLAVGGTTVSTSNKSSNSSDVQPASDNSSVTTLITLAVTADQAARIIHAERTGTMTFALLGADATPSAGSGVSDKGLFTGGTP